MTLQVEARRMAGFAAIPAVGALSPLLAIPAITSEYGASGWAAIAFGQAFGTAFSLVVEMGWGLTGPQRVARADRAESRHLYLRCVATQGVVFVGCAPVLIAVTVLGQSIFVGASVLAALGAAAVGFSPAWYFVGAGTPTQVLLTDSLPKVVLTAVLAGALVAGAPLWLYSAGTLLAALLAPVIGALIVGLEDVRLDRRTLATDLRDQVSALSGRVLVAAHLSAPTVLLGFAGAPALPLFAAADRLQKMLLTVLTTAPNSLQRWFGSDGPWVRKLQISLGLNGGIGLLAAVLFWAGAPAAARALFSGEIALSHGVAAVAAVSIPLLCLTRVTGNLGLVRVGRVGWVTGSAFVALLVVGLGVPLGAARGGASGAWWAVAAGLTVMLAIQGCGLWRVRHEHS